MRKFNLALAAFAVCTATAASAEKDWVLNGDQSVVSFGSVKADNIGEAHTFSGLTGSVSADGAAMVEIDLSTVNTNIDIRNERIIEHVFKNAPSAMLKAQIDMADFEGLGVGDSTVLEIEGDVALLGEDVPVYMDVFAMRLSEENVMVSTHSMMFVSTDELGIDAGIDKLMELASLPGITRSVPVTFRLMFSSGSTES